MLKVNGYDVINPKEWPLWIIMALWSFGCGLGFAYTSDGPAALFLGLGLLGGALFMLRPDSWIRRYRFAKSIRGWTTGGVGVRGQVSVAGMRGHVETMSDQAVFHMVDAGLQAAINSFNYGLVNQAFATADHFRGKIIQFLPGRLYDRDGAHEIESNVEPGASGLGNVGVLGTDTADIVRDRIRFLGLRQLLAASGSHGTEAQHRAELQRLGIDARV